jgi:hypothetical protein
MQAYVTIMKKFNTLQLVEPVKEETHDFFGRPFMVSCSGDAVQKLQTLYAGTALADFPLIGSIDLITSSTDVLENNAVCLRMRGLWGAS